jgi:hypothetical protein
MVMHTELDIYKAAYELLSLATDLTQNIRRDIKASLGRKISDECVDLLVIIARANAAKDKTPHLTEMIERAQVVDFLLRVLKDKGFITVKQLTPAMKLIASIGKQANGWKKYTASPAS